MDRCRCKYYSAELGYCPREHCDQKHPPPCQYDATCHHAHCSRMHSVPKCDRGNSCNKRCGKRHVKEGGACENASLSETASNASRSSRDSCSSRSTNRPSPSMCRYGANCKDRRCTRAHPTAEPLAESSAPQPNSSDELPPSSSSTDQHLELSGASQQPETDNHNKVEEDLTLISIPNLPNLILTEILGKCNVNVPVLLGLLKCHSIEADVSKQLLLCRCKSSLEPQIRQKLQELIQNAREYLLVHAQEEVFLGQTRVVFGSGLSVQNFLPNVQDFVLIRLWDLPPKFQQEDVTNLIMRAAQRFDLAAENLQGLVREVTMGVLSKPQSSDCNWSQVRISNPIWAAKILSALQGEDFGIGTFHASAGGIRIPSISHSISAHFDIVAATDVHSGTVQLFYNDALTANRLIVFCDYRAFPKYAKIGKETIPCKNASFPATYENADPRTSSFVVALKNCFLDEEGLLEHARLRHWPMPAKVVVLRGKPNEKREISCSPVPFSTADSDAIIARMDLDELRALFPFSDQSGVTKREVTVGVRSRTLTVRHTILSPTIAQHLFDRQTWVLPKPLKRFDQPVRCFPRFVATFSVHFVVASLCRDRINKIMAEFSSQSGQEATKIKSENKETELVEFQFAARTLEALNAIANRWQETLLPSGTFQPPNKSILFSFYGRRRLEEIAREHYLHWLRRSQMIYIYTESNDALAQAKTALEALVKELETYETGTRFYLARSYARTIQASMRVQGNDKSLAAALCEEFGDGLELADAQLMNSGVLIVTATPASMALLKQKLEPHIWQRKRANNASSATEATEEANSDECPICFCDPDFTLQFCGHRFCKSCLQDHFTYSDDIHAPLKCPGAGCNAEMTLGDIESIAPAVMLSRLKEDSVYRYVRDSVGSDQNLVICPSPTCGQILSVKKPSATASEAMLGGHIASCDLCRRAYCLFCSLRSDKPVPAHVGWPCNANLESSPTSLSAARTKLLDLLNTRCPACTGVIYDFNGCFALTCQCGAALCGFCLFHDPSGDSHRHVANCTQNPEPGNYFAPVQVWESKRRDDARKRIIEALKQIPHAMRSELLLAVAKDLKDVGIFISPKEMEL